jgi:hypothetical protein
VGGYAEPNSQRVVFEPWRLSDNSNSRLLRSQRLCPPSLLHAWLKLRPSTHDFCFNLTELTWTPPQLRYELRLSRL